MDERPTYGYRRLAALLNRHLRSHDQPTVNRKRVLRILQVNGLTLERYTAQRPARTREGVVVALRSNIRWCSDHLELHCRDGSIVRVLFTIDACDWEIIAWSATTEGVSGKMVRDLMVACVEARFGATRIPYPVEWLSDNGSAYIAKETARIATALGLRLAFTPVRSRESNGISEAFVKCRCPVARAAVRARLRLLDNLATSRTKLLAAHFAYPEIGAVVRSGTNFRFTAIY